MPANPWLARLVRDFDDRDDELRAAAAKVQDTLNSPGWQIITGLVEAAQKDATSVLFNGHRGGSGKVLEQAEYSRLCGYLAGLGEPLSAAQAYEQAVGRLVSSDSPE